MRFLTTEPIDVVLSPEFCEAVQVPAGTVLPLWRASIEDGWLLADYQEPGGGVRRYAVPPQHVIYVRQLQSANDVPPPVTLPSN